MAFDHDIIQRWVTRGSRVLDLGCGDGSLLRTLTDQLGVEGYGLEIDEARISACLDNGVNVIEQDLDQGLGNFQDNSFDLVVMTQTLQAVRYPHRVLKETLRVGKECIITFPNFAHWRSRFYLNSRGRMPVSEFMPYTWYDTPNIHFCTVLDFEDLCREMNICILNRMVVDEQNRNTLAVRMFPNVFGVTALYHVSR